MVLFVCLFAMVCFVLGISAWVRGEYEGGLGGEQNWAT